MTALRLVKTVLNAEYGGPFCPCFATFRGTPNSALVAAATGTLPPIMPLCIGS